MALKTQTKVNLFKVKETYITGGHNLMISKEQCELVIKTYLFSQRVLRIWNNLPPDCVNLFKNRIDKYIIKTGYV